MKIDGPFLFLNEALKPIIMLNIINKIKSTSDGTYSASASLNWLIFNFGKTNAKIEFLTKKNIELSNSLKSLNLHI